MYLHLKVFIEFCKSARNLVHLYLVGMTCWFSLLTEMWRCFFLALLSMAWLVFRHWQRPTEDCDVQETEKWHHSPSHLSQCIFSAPPSQVQCILHTVWRTWLFSTSSYCNCSVHSELWWYKSVAISSCWSERVLQCHVSRPTVKWKYSSFSSYRRFLFGW